MKNLIDIERLEKEEIQKLIKTAEEFKNGRQNSCAAGKCACLMFFENSTRTHFSFELAAKRLGMHVLNFDAKTSSFSKGESMKDTFENLNFIGVDVFVLRHSENGIIDKIRSEIAYPMRFVNAGDGKNAHPTQALLDFYTMKKHLGEINGKKVVIIGDVAHSRVARSNFALLKKFNADVVMLLRVQNERLDGETAQKAKDYTKNYRLNSKMLKKLAPNALLMHPGPVNRGVEITSELLDSEKGRTILEQAKNGVFVRMAVLDEIFREEA